MIESIDSPYIHSANAENFNALVIDNSNLGPVIVNFWSKKAGPCLRQSPILDKLIHQYDGRALLVNVDTETEIAVSKDYGIASVPTLKLFRNGQVVETLHGYQSEEDLLKVLEQYVARDSDLLLADAIQLYSEGERVAAYEKIASAIADDPVNHRLPLAMCKLLKHEVRYDEALKLITSLPADIKSNLEVIQFQNVLGFLVEAESIPDFDSVTQAIEAKPDNLQAQQQWITHLINKQQYEAALDVLVTMIEREPNYNENYPQKTMLKIFSIIGLEHELIAKYRPSLKRYTH